MGSETKNKLSSQSKKFIEAAKKLECEDNAEEFDKALTQIAKAGGKDKDKPKEK